MKHKPHTILITRFPFESILSGEEWHTITLAQQLQKRGHRVAFLGKCNVLFDMLKRDDIPVYQTWGGTLPVTKQAAIRFLFTWPFILVNLWFRFLVIKFKEHIDRVYMLSLTEKILLTPLTVMMGIPTVWVEHQRIGRWLRLSPLRPFYIFFSHWVKVVGVSPDHVQSLKKLKIAGKNLRLITNGIDTEVFTTKVTELYPKIVSLRIGTIARLYKDKGIHILLEALSKVTKEFKITLELFILGEGPEKKDLMELSRTLGVHQNTLFLKPYTDVKREDTPRFIQSLDIFVLPSTKHDPFGLVVAESMAVGVPVVLTDVCGISTFLTHKKDAYIVKANDVEALAVGLLELIEEPHLRVEIASHGLATCHENFTLDRMVGEYEDVLRLG